jgi:hypothetical protein
VSTDAFLAIACLASLAVNALLVLRASRTSARLDELERTRPRYDVFGQMIGFGMSCLNVRIKSLRESVSKQRDEIATLSDRVDFLADDSDDIDTEVLGVDDDEGESILTKASDEPKIATPCHVIHFENADALTRWLATMFGPKTEGGAT